MLNCLFLGVNLRLDDFVVIFVANQRLMSTGRTGQENLSFGPEWGPPHLAALSISLAALKRALCEGALFRAAKLIVTAVWWGQIWYGRLRNILARVRWKTLAI